MFSSGGRRRGRAASAANRLRFASRQRRGADIYFRERCRGGAALFFAEKGEGYERERAGMEKGRREERIGGEPQRAGDGGVRRGAGAGGDDAGGGEGGRVQPLHGLQRRESDPAFRATWDEAAAKGSRPQLIARRRTGAGSRSGSRARSSPPRARKPISPISPRPAIRRRPRGSRGFPTAPSTPTGGPIPNSPPHGARRSTRASPGSRRSWRASGSRR